MNICELLENQMPMKFVAGRDFDLVPNTNFHGYTLGVELDDKALYSVYKYVGSKEVNIGIRTITQKEYIKIHSVIDPKDNETHSPYVKGINIKDMYRYTVDKLISGELQPEKVVHVPMVKNPEENQDLKEFEESLAEAFRLRLGDKDLSNPTGNSNYIWIKQNNGSDWEKYRKQASESEAISVAKRMRMAIQADVAIGNSTQPTMYPDGTLVKSDFGTERTSNEEYPNSATGALQFLRKNSTYNISGAIATQDKQVPGAWIVRTRSGNVYVNLTNKTFNAMS